MLEVINIIIQKDPTDIVFVEKYDGVEPAKYLSCERYFLRRIRAHSFHKALKNSITSS